MSQYISLSMMIQIIIYSFEQYVMNHSRVVFLFFLFYFLHTDWWTTQCVFLRFFPLTTVKFCRGTSILLNISVISHYFKDVLRYQHIWFWGKGFVCELILFVTFLLPLQTTEPLFVHRKSFNWVYLLLFCSTELNYVCKTMYACVYVLYGVSTPGFCNK